MPSAFSSPFVNGLQLCEAFYREAVHPLLDTHFPHLPHAAALIGPGSEVLGFDDAMSTDHHWGPRVMLFLEEGDHASHAAALHDMLAQELPFEFHGWPTHFSEPLPGEVTQLLQPTDQRPINHRVELLTMRGYWQEVLGFDVVQAIKPADWLSFSEQKLLSLTAGAVYHDDIGLGLLRQRFDYYPRDVWLYLLAAGWTRLGQEDHLMGRAGLVGDEIGSALIGARLVRDIMRLGFLMEQVYAPYPKWFGSAFKQLRCADALEASLQGALQATNWQVREGHLVAAYEQLARMHNALGVTDPLPTHVGSFHGRPFQVVTHHGFASALLAQIQEPAVQKIAQRPVIGSLEQFSDSTDLVSDGSWRPVLRRFYE